MKAWHAETSDGTLKGGGLGLGFRVRNLVFKAFAYSKEPSIDKQSVVGCTVELLGTSDFYIKKTRR